MPNPQSKSNKIVQSLRRRAQKKAEGGYIEDDEREMSDADMDNDLDNEPLGDDWASDEFLADPFGEMDESNHSLFDPETDEESESKGPRLSRIMNEMRMKRRLKS